MASVKKVVKSKGAAKKWLWWYRLMVKNLITTIQVNLCCLIPGISTNWPELLLLKFLPSTYTITVISWPPSLISQPFHTDHFKQGRTFFLQLVCFFVDYRITWGTKGYSKACVYQLLFNSVMHQYGILMNFR